MIDLTSDSESAADSEDDATASASTRIDSNLDEGEGDAGASSEASEGSSHLDFDETAVPSSPEVAYKDRPVVEPSGPSSASAVRPQYRRSNAFILSSDGDEAVGARTSSSRFAPASSASYAEVYTIASEPVESESQVDWGGSQSQSQM